MHRIRSMGFTGYRPNKLPFKSESDPKCIALKKRIREVIEEAIQLHGVSHFICGMALGSDAYFAEEVLALKVENPQISLEAAIPHEEQANSWSDAARDRYFNILAIADDVTFVSRKYHKYCFSLRNEYIVDHSDIMIAVYDGQPGGTQSTVNKAKRKGKPITLIDPSSL